MVSVTAYQGIFEILDVKPEHTVVISGAAGYVIKQTRILFCS